MLCGSGFTAAVFQVYREDISMYHVHWDVSLATGP